ncbi:MAG TPA: putative toxin-antitoxin system toxin component, PIN family [Pyrinomonadaceae bacterium]
MKFLTEISAVFDCNVLLQAIANGASPAAACFRLVEKRVVELFVSEETLAELEEVLNRNFIKERFNLTVEAINEFIGNLRVLAKVFTDVPQVFSLPRDVDDEAYINLAVQSKAGFIVTRDKDLLYLMNSYDPESKEFRQRFRPLKIVAPLEFLKIVEDDLSKVISIKP